MNLQDFLNKYSEEPSASREELVLKGVSEGWLFCQWLPIESNYNGHHGRFWVGDDAVRLEENGQRFRPQGSARLLQKVADLMGGSLLTDKLMDLSYEQADAKLDACTLKAGPKMESKQYSIDFNNAVEEKRAGKTGLIRDCGKTWMLHNGMATGAGAVNCGFYSKDAIYRSPGGFKLWQNAGTKHNALHADYSQVILIMNQICQIDGEDMNIADVICNKDLCGLVSYYGVIKFSRQR